MPNLEDLVLSSRRDLSWACRPHAELGTGKRENLLLEGRRTPVGRFVLEDELRYRPF